MDRRITRRRVRRRWRWVAGGLALALTAGLGWQLLPAAGSTDIVAATIETGAVERAPFEDYLPIRAAVAPKVTTLVDTLSGGQVEKLLVQDGAWVTAGQPLATLVNPTLKLDVLTREAEIASQLGTLTGDELSLERSRLDRAAQTASANYDLLKARRDLAIRQQLHDQGSFPTRASKAIRKRPSTSTSAWASCARSGPRRPHRRAPGLAPGRYQRPPDRQSRGGARRARRAGGARPGHRPSRQSGDPAGADPRGRRPRGAGRWRGRLETGGRRGRVSRPRCRGQQAKGEAGIALVVSKVLPAVANGRFHIELGFAGQPPQGLNRGQTMDIRATLGATSKALVAPVGGWLDSGGGTSAFVVDPDGRHARRRAVKVGRRNPAQVEILAGLSPGDRIVTSNTASITGDILNLR
jgi:HlyD family secretion protein